MTHLSTFAVRYARPMAALALVVPAYWFARLPEISTRERADLAQHFHFTRRVLPDVSDHPYRDSRPVHPSLAHISAWINSLGAAVALGDLDGDGLANDIAWVETRSDQVFVAPVPGTPARYAAFELDPAPLPYDSHTMAPMGCRFCDANEDGLTDVLVYYWGRTPILFLRRADLATGSANGSTSVPASSSGAGQPNAIDRASFLARELVPGTERWFTNAATFADLDGDGHVDLVIGNYFHDGARILDASATGREEMQDSMTRAYNGGNKHFFLWKKATAGVEPDVAFEEVPIQLGADHDRGWTLAIGAADLDGDLLPELYFAHDFGPDLLLHNRSRPGELAFEPLFGERTMTMPSSKVLGRDSFKGMGVDFGDLNGDGLLDIYVSNITSQYALEESQFAFVSTGETKRMKDGVAPYIDDSESLGLSRSGWAWEARLSDFDNDGVLEAQQAVGFLKGNANRWPELHEDAMGNDQLLSDPRVWHHFLPGDDLSGHEPQPFFVRASDGRYYDLARDIGLATQQVSRAIATADFDGDGRLDFAIGNQWEPSAVYWNDAPDAGAFLGLRLLLPVGTETQSETRVIDHRPSEDSREASSAAARVAPSKSAASKVRGRPAIGAEARVETPDGRHLVAQVDGGNGHSGARSPELHFGLGRGVPPATVRAEVRWRDVFGALHKRTFALAPGWHTLLLGTESKEDAHADR